jgi:hypothetical protein
VSLNGEAKPKFNFHFLVPSQFAKLEGVEKALRVKVIAALFPERLQSFFPL